ncbi:MAG: multicopper oxidase domain-containing protein, partial [candidate division NC10 bacterium]
MREIALVAKETRWELAPGKVIKAWAYNGRVPGPEIRLREGERVRIVLMNALPEPTTIHWHGVDVPNPMDGVPGVTQAPVRPGETFTYEFEARPAGTRWYHTHFQEHKQLDLGLYAPLIIEPAEAEPSP